jgi:hypothetical protein
MANKNDMSLFGKQVSMFKGLFKSMSSASAQQEDAADALNKANKSLFKATRSVSRKEMREDFGKIGDDLRDYQKLMKKYNAKNADDLKKLTRIASRFYDNEDDVKKMQDNFNDALKDMEEKAVDASQRMRDRMAQNLAILGIGDIQGKMDDEVMNVTEMSNAIKKASKLTSDQTIQLRKDLISGFKDINKETGKQLVGYQDIMQNAQLLSENMDIADPKKLASLAKDLTLLKQASEVSDDVSMKALEKLDQRGFTDKDRKEFLDSFVNVMKGQMVDDDKVMGSVNTLSDAISTFSDGNKELAKAMNTSIMSSATLFENNYLDSEKFMDTFKSAILENDPEAMAQLSTQLSQAGLSLADAQNAFQTGNFDDFSADYIKSVGKLFEESSGNNRKALAEMYGIDPGEINKFIKSSKTADKSLEELHKNLEEGTGVTKQASEQTKLWHEQIANWISGIEIFGVDVGTVTDTMGGNPLQMYASIMIAKDAIGGLGKGADKTKELLGKFRGGGGLGGAITKSKDFATNMGGSLLTSVKTMSATIWTTVIPSLVALAKASWGAMTGKGLGGFKDVFGRGKKGKGSGPEVKPPTTPSTPPGGSKLLSGASKVAVPVAIGAGAIGMMTNDNKSEAAMATAGSAAGGWAGAAGGAAAGAAIGSVVPVVGTAAGGVIGGLVGGLGGGLGGDWLGRKANKLAENWDIPFFEKGTNYVPKDGLAYIHEGEAVVPKEYNPDAGFDSGVQTLLHETNRSRAMEKKLEERHRDANQEKQQPVDTASVVDAINTLTNFMKYWHQDELERSRRQDRKTDPWANQRQEVAGQWGG